MNLDLFMIISTALGGTYLLMISFLMTTKTIPSMFLFKFLPFILGLTSYFTCAKMLSII